MPSHISENIAGHMSQLEVYMSTRPGANVGTCMALMAGTIQKVSIENIHTLTQLRESHDQLCEAHDQLCELRESRDKLLKSQNEVNQKLELYQEKIAHLESAMTTHSTRSEQQEKRIDSHHFAMTQSHKKFSQQVSGLQESLAQQKDELTTMMKSSERESRDKLHKSQNEANQKLEQYQEKIAQLERAMTTHSTRSEQQEKRIDSHHFAMTQSHKMFSQQVSGLQESLAQQKDELTTMMKSSEEKLEKSSRKLSFDFTLTAFKSKKENDIFWYSLPFYTHTHGYRMCISVCANGYGYGKGTHLSVFASLMKGPFDDYLEWPFQGTLTIQLLNQLKDVNHHTCTISFTDTTDHEVVGRVTSGESAENGFGHHTFLPHTELDLKSKDDCQYLKDNQLKFRVSS